MKQQFLNYDEDQKKALERVIKRSYSNRKIYVQLEAMDSDASPFMITQPEFMRRMKEMQASGGGGWNVWNG